MKREYRGVERYEDDGDKLVADCVVTSESVVVATTGVATPISEAVSLTSFLDATGDGVMSGIFLGVDCALVSYVSPVTGRELRYSAMSLDRHPTPRTDPLRTGRGNVPFFNSRYTLERDSPTRCCTSGNTKMRSNGDRLSRSTFFVVSSCGMHAPSNELMPSSLTKVDAAVGREKPEIGVHRPTRS